MSMLIEITGDDIAALGDADLRDLIGLLCEADYRLAGLSTAGIKWGGHQDAADGGLDVVVDGDVSPPDASFVPRNATGFQVKKSDMPKARILKEMRSGGKLRESIKALLQDNGAYIIVSSADSTTNTALTRRTGAMNEAVSNEIGHEDFHLDFFDRGRVATWVRSHPSMVIWVREKIKKPLSGWQGYGDWTHASGEVEDEYIHDDCLRLHDGNNSTNQSLSIEDGLLKLRSALQKPRASIRLTGLSGVGKTRLVQALFDSKVGENALNQHQAIYTDMADSPSPAPVAMASQLINGGSRTVLIVDNCPPDLHHRLTQSCSVQQSTVSLITVEYDVLDDLPEETDVFMLESASEKVIERLIDRRKQFAHISQVDMRTIANFSGGNARIAIALANTVKKGETLSGFRDEELFKRLFWQQRHAPDQNLLISAQACALVYSFEGTDASSKKSEIKFLASLVDKTGTELFRDITKLMERDLIQSRGVWRAVLPPAIANRLAKGALESIPKDILVDRFLGSPERLIKSFTRRLSYLHDCDTAIGIVNDWLAPDGWIGKGVGNLNDFGIDVLSNIAPVSPANTFEAIERAVNGGDGYAFTSNNNPHSGEFVRLLRHLAYDSELFDRSARLLCRFALSGDQDARDTLKSLFCIRLSGTRARIEDRARIIEELIDSEDESKQEIGFLLLNASLKTRLFSSFHEFNFGARSRDYGYHPKTHEEVARWYNIVINICSRVALSDRSISKQAKKILANNLRNLWRTGRVFDSLEQPVREIRGQGAWNDGWIAVCEIIQYDSNSFTDVDKKRVCGLEKLLSPDSLLEKARAFALSGQHGGFDLEEGCNEEDAVTRYRRTEETTRKIGVEVAQDSETLNALLPELVSTDSRRLVHFGIGLAEGSNDKKELFQALYAELAKTTAEMRRIDVFVGFLRSCAESDPALYNSILDDLVRDDLLGKWFPEIQICTSTMDQRGVKRLHESLDLGIAEIQLFRHLVFGRAHEPISDDDLAALLNKILLREGGVGVALEILYMRFFNHNLESSNYSDDLMAVARNLMATFPFAENNNVDTPDCKLEKVANICLAGQKGSHAATITCENLDKEISEYRLSFFNYPLLFNSLAKVQPTIYLDVFLKNDPLITHSDEQCRNPLDQISDVDLLSWCEKAPSSRYVLIASWMQPFSKSDETGKYEWRSFVYTMFDKAPVLEDVLERLANKPGLMSWVSSRADALQDSAVLYQALCRNNNEKVAIWARNEHEKLQERIKQEREQEDQENREQNERFE